MDLLFKKEVFEIVGSAMEVLNKLGHGLHEKPYENAMVVEFQLREIPYVQQPSYTIDYKGVTVGSFILDLIAYQAIVVDTKTIIKITDQEIGKMINYLKITGLRVGLILNFYRSTLEWERVVV